MRSALSTQEPRSHCGWLFLGVDVLIALVALPAQSLATGATLLAAVLCYFWWLHRSAHQRWHAEQHLREAAADMVVGPFLAIGLLWALCTSASIDHVMPALAPITGFAVVASLNCRFLTHWQREKAHPPSAPAFARSGTGWIALTLAGVAVTLSFLSSTRLEQTNSEVWLCLAVACFGLAALNRAHRSLATDQLRLMADLALLTPLLAPAFLATGRCLANAVLHRSSRLRTIRARRVLRS